MLGAGLWDCHGVVGGGRVDGPVSNRGRAELRKGVSPLSLGWGRRRMLGLVEE